MKQCPVCKTTYTDDTLRYCLSDGAALGDNEEDQATVLRKGGAESEETVFMGAAGEQVRVEIPQPTAQAPRPVYQAAESASGGSSGVIYKVLAVVLVLGILAVLAVAAVTFIYFKLGPPEKAPVDTNKDIKGTAQSPTPTPKDDTEELREQIANLEKLLNDQKKTNQGANIPLNFPNQPSSVTTARVNSPGDGFLALRTFPNSQAGSKILEIPHGASVSVGGCLNSSRIGNKTGRWCRANYNGYTGWVFDAFLIY